MLGKGGLLDVRVADQIVDTFFRIIEVPEDLHPVRVCQNLKISCGTVPTGIRSIEKTVQIVLNVFLFHHRLLILEYSNRSLYPLFMVLRFFTTSPFYKKLSMDFYS